MNKFFKKFFGLDQCEKPSYDRPYYYNQRRESYYAVVSRMLFGIFQQFNVLGPIMFTLKLCGKIDWSWWIIFLPIIVSTLHGFGHDILSNHIRKLEGEAIRKRNQESIAEWRKNHPEDLNNDDENIGNPDAYIRENFDEDEE